MTAVAEAEPERVARFEARGAAVSLLRSRRPQVTISGPAGTGKSVVMLYKLHVTAMKVDGLTALLCRQTGVSLTATTLKTFEKSVARHELADGSVRWFGGSRHRPAAYQYLATGAELVVGGLDKPEKFLSSDFDRIAVDEITETTQDAYEVLISRLRGTAGTYKQLSGACNPNAPTHWVKARADAGQMELLTSTHRDNPAYFNLDGTPTPAGADYMAMLGGLTGMRRKRLLEGRWSAAEGLVYEYDPQVHLLDKLPPGSESWPRFWSLDFGWTHPFVWLDFAGDPDGRLYLVHEIHMTGRLVEDHARKVLETVAPGGVWNEPRPSAVVADHDAEGRATFEKYAGVSTRPAHKSVLEGIEAVQARLRVAGDGKPRLYLVNGALVEVDPVLVAAKQPTCLADELLAYAWPADVKPSAREHPVKEFDDAADAMRYVVAERDLGARPRYRSFPR